MATKDLEEEYRNLLEENSQYEQLIDQLKEQLVSLDKETAEAERKIEEMRVLHITRREQMKRLKQRERLLFKNLEMETKKFNDIVHRNIDHSKELASLLDQRKDKLKTQEDLDQQLAEQRATKAKLESGVIDALEKRSMTEAQMLKTKMNLDEETLQFTKNNERLKMKAEQNSKLQAFVEKKLQTIIPVENKDITDILEQQEPFNLSSRDLVGATGIDPCTQNKKTNLSLTKHLNELEKTRNMLEERITKTRRDILMLEQEHNLEQDLDAELKNRTELADSLEEEEKVAQKTLNELAAGISGLLKDIQKPADVTSNNITDCLDILEESIYDLHIHAKRVEDLQNLSLPNDNLLPEMPKEETKNEEEVDSDESSGSLTTLGDESSLFLLTHQ